ncbi:hypothetical protein N9B82_06195 [Saprospiraceae bacterium]|nr:hypothetical protein [Saprospiraceae bacterium]
MTDLIALHDSSRVWIYQADSFFEEEQIEDVKQSIREFVNQWVSHSNDLRAYGNIFHKRFLCLFVDETQSGASGCSIDSSVRFVNHIGQQYGKNMIEREHFGYIKDDEVYFLHMNKLAESVKSGLVDSETLFFDNLVTNKLDFINSWLKPLQESWHKRFM